MKICSMILMSLTLCAIALAAAVPLQVEPETFARHLDARIDTVPPITNPTADTVWVVGNVYTVTWYAHVFPADGVDPEPA